MIFKSLMIAYFGVSSLFIAEFAALVTAQAAVKEQAYEYYSHGHLSLAARLPLEGPGWVKLFQPRARLWGTDQLVQVIQKVALYLESTFSPRDRLQIGDMAAQQGGYVSGHASHQNGLDVDIAFFRKQQTEQDPDDTRGFVKHFVRSGKLSSDFDLERNWALVKALVSTGKVKRIFTDAAVKSALCKYSAARGDKNYYTQALRRIQPWPNHDDHFHVRLVCPAGTRHCISQSDPPAGTGCDRIYTALPGSIEMP